LVFFFQAEDGIRDFHVTGVQTCALPISRRTPPGADMAIVTVERLAKSFGSHEILKGIDLTVEPSEVVVIIGASGSGKSTLLRCMNRLEEPTSGAIYLEGVDITSPKVNINQVRREIGMVFQSINLYPHMTALGNVTLALRKVLKLPKKEAEERTENYRSTVGLADKMRHYPAQ